MATSDLLNELQKDSFKVDADMERKLCTVILTQLDDASGDISGLAVKW
jgi:cullin-associated NEDD8-dissociated protein 1